MVSFVDAAVYRSASLQRGVKAFKSLKLQDNNRYNHGCRPAQDLQAPKECGCGNAVREGEGEKEKEGGQVHTLGGVFRKATLSALKGDRQITRGYNLWSCPYLSFRRNVVPYETLEHMQAVGLHYWPTRIHRTY
jgi:hypothetical protein